MPLQFPLVSASVSASVAAPVLILGAGIAGMQAARTLAAHGVPHLILEARERIGGRVVTDWRLDAPADLGASWIHGVDGNPIADFARKHGIRTVPDPLAPIAIFDAAGHRLDIADATIIDEMFHGLKRLAAANPALVAQSRTVADFIARERSRWADRTDAQIALAMGILGAIFGALPDELAAVALLHDDAFPGSHHLFPKGIGAIATQLAKGANVRTNCRVLSVDATGKGVLVRTTRGDFRGRAAIVTVPLGILKAGEIRFDPPLPPAKLGAIDRLGFGVLNKIFLTFAHVAWPAELSAIRLPGPIPYVLCANRLNAAPMLIGFLGGQIAREWEAKTDGAIVADFVANLRAAFGPDFPAPVDVAITRWSQDVFARGSYPFLAPGAGIADLKALAAPVPDPLRAGPSKLFFAGDATHPDYFATIHGAFLSGERAAREVLAGLGQALAV